MIVVISYTGSKYFDVGEEGEYSFQGGLTDDMVIEKVKEMKEDYMLNEVKRQHIGSDGIVTQEKVLELDEFLVAFSRDTLR